MPFDLLYRDLSTYRDFHCLEDIKTASEALKNKSKIVQKARSYSHLC